MTELALLERRSLLRERWQSLPRDEAEPWTERAAIAAKLLSAEDAVVDLGCGTMSLEMHLRPGTRYIPVDIVRRDARTIVYDINKESLPLFEAPVVVCLGLIEYVVDVPCFMKALADRFERCIASYCICDAPKPLKPRRSHGWFNDYSRDQIEDVFRIAGWQSQFLQIVGDIQALWRLKRK